MTPGSEPHSNDIDRLSDPAEADYDLPDPPALTPHEVAQIRDTIREVFPRWHVWHDHAGWHAMRRGNYRQFREDQAGVYAVHSAHPIVLALMLDEQDQIPPPDGWDTPEPPARAKRLTQLERALQPQPVDLSRDVIAARLEASHPGWRITHDPYGWTATRLDDPEVQVRGQSSPALEALLPVAGQ